MEYISQNDQRMKLMESQLTFIHSLLLQRAPNTLPSQTKANPKKKEVNAMSTKSGRPMTE